MGLFAKKQIGDIGELAAAKYLKKKKYRIIRRNFSTKLGEIDIICENKEYIVFVEVKTRKHNSPVPGVASINYRKQCHIKRVAQLFLRKYITEKQPRFDAVEVEYFDDGTVRVKEHYEGAF